MHLYSCCYGNHSVNLLVSLLRERKNQYRRWGSPESLGGNLLNNSTGPIPLTTIIKSNLKRRVCYIFPRTRNDQGGKRSLAFLFRPEHFSTNKPKSFCFPRIYLIYSTTQYEQQKFSASNGNFFPRMINLLVHATHYLRFYTCNHF